MKNLILLFTLIFSSSSFASRVAPPNMNEPPFWMSCYEEFRDLQTFQKKYYVRNFLRHVSDLKMMKVPTPAKMTEAAEWDAAWDEIRERVYVACQDQKNLKTCVDLAEVRLKTFEAEEETQFEH